MLSRITDSLTPTSHNCSACLQTHFPFNAEMYEQIKVTFSGVIAEAFLHRFLGVADHQFNFFEAIAIAHGNSKSIRLVKES